MSRHHVQKVTVKPFQYFDQKQAWNLRNSFLNHLLDNNKATNENKEKQHCLILSGTNLYLFRVNFVIKF